MEAYGVRSFHNTHRSSSGLGGHDQSQHPMLTIRAQQFAAFAAALDPHRSEFLLDHLRLNHADKAEKMGHVGLADFVSQELKRATEFGLTERADICRLLDVVIVLGPILSASDSAWLNSLMRDTQIKIPARRIDKLHRQFLYRLEEMSEC